MLDDRVRPFLIAGISDGNAILFKKDVAVGIGFGFDTTASKARDVLGIGLAWGNPPVTGCRNRLPERFILGSNVWTTSPSPRLAR
ncbi:hypothetical protein ACFMPD_16030 [Sedimentitalea sp. HM32M-2]|uniref:hypothetical protein n=1 Tax=Sedimentitalea sp. HM32M-2 TaxID=3351566 RepID=UPI00363D419E